MALGLMLSRFRQYTWLERLRLLLYPVWALWEMPVLWAKSLYASRVLLGGQWEKYMGFEPTRAVNNLFYQTQWINLNRYGRFNKSPLLGLGNLDLRNWFHLSALASYVFANAGAVVTLGGSFVWAMGHLLWVSCNQTYWVIIITTILTLSSANYAMAFARQNYQILAWMWYPLALYTTFNADILPASLAWAASALFGITPIVFAVPVVFTIAVSQENLLIGITLGPAILTVTGRLLPLFQTGAIKESLKQTAKLIGLKSSNVRYRRNQPYGLANWYFTVLYSVAATLMWISNQEPPLTLATGILLYFINEKFFRVADSQSMHILLISLFGLTAMSNQPSWLCLIALVIGVNPLPLAVGIHESNNKQNTSCIYPYAPFDCTTARKSVSEFFKSVAAGDRVIFAFDDPGNSYFRLFDGYRIIHELPLNIASRAGWHLMPDWYAVTETNYEGAPEIWGRSAKQVINNCYYWQAKYAVVYQARDCNLRGLWLDLFDLVSELDWGSDQHYKSLGPHFWRSIKCSPPKWFLLAPKRLDALL